MQDNRRNNDQKDVDLTGMIHEYSQDDELRKKIEAMKREKESKKTQDFSDKGQQETYHSSLFDDVRPSNMFTEKKETAIPDIKMDQTQLEKTRVGFQDSDANKTLVIMDGKKATSFGEEKTITPTDASMYAYRDDMQKDDLDQTMVTSSMDMEEDVHTLDLDDEEEYEEHPKKSKDKSDEKTNKIITYVILALVSIALFVAGFFGMRFLLGGGGSSEKVDEEKAAELEKKKKEEQAKKEKLEEERLREEERKKNEEAQKDKEEIENNEATVNALEKQLKEYEAYLSDINFKLESAESEKNKAQQKLNELLETANAASRAYSENDTIISTSTAELKEINKKLESDSANAELLNQQQSVQTKLDEATGKKAELEKALSEANSAYNNSQYKSTVSQAEGKISELNDQKKSYETKIAETKNKLAQYQ